MGMTRRGKGKRMKKAEKKRSHLTGTKMTMTTSPTESRRRIPSTSLRSAATALELEQGF